MLGDTADHALCKLSHSCIIQLTQIKHFVCPRCWPPDSKDLAMNKFLFLFFKWFSLVRIMEVCEGGKEKIQTELGKC